LKKIDDRLVFQSVNINLLKSGILILFEIRFKITKKSDNLSIFGFKIQNSKFKIQDLSVMPYDH